MTAIRRRSEQVCRVGGKISGSYFQNYRLRTFQNFQLWTPTPQHQGDEIWLLKSMEIVLHSKKSLFQQKFQKKLYHFNKDFQFGSVM